jgi:hypothetical protein
MTHVPSIHPHPAPSRLWYVVAAAVALAGWGGMGLFLMTRLKDSPDRMMRFLAPGDAVLRLSKTGTYTIFHEYRSNLDGRTYDSPTVSGLDIKVTAQPGGELVTLKAGMNSNYDIGNHAGRSLFDFEVSQPGSFHVVAAYPDGRKAPQAVISIDQGFVGDLLITIFASIAMVFIAMGLAVAIIVTVAVKRNRAAKLAGAPV